MWLCLRVSVVSLRLCAEQGERVSLCARTSTRTEVKSIPIVWRAHLCVLDAHMCVCARLGTQKHILYSFSVEKFVCVACNHINPLGALK